MLGSRFPSERGRRLRRVPQRWPRCLPTHFANHHSCGAEKKLPQVFVGFLFLIKILEKALDCVRNFGRGAAVSHRAGDGGKLTHAAADAEIVGVNHLAVLFYFLAFDADVGDPVLPATVRAAGNVEFQLLLEAREPIVKLFAEPTGKAFGFSKRELAEFRASASDGATGEGGGFNGKACGGEFGGDFVPVFVRYVYNDQILHDGGTQMAVSVFVRKCGGGAELIGSEATAEDADAHVGETGLFLRVDAYVVPVDVGGCRFDFAGVQRKAHNLLEFGEERVGGPAVFKEKIFQASFVAADAQNFAGAENFPLPLWPRQPPDQV